MSDDDGQFLQCEWGYGGENGPSLWHLVEGGIYPIAVSGDRQSPINISTTSQTGVETSEELGELELAYPSGSICKSIKNCGHSWKVDVVHNEELGTVDVDNDISREYPTQPALLTGGPLGDNTYQLAQFHAHWGGENSRGSEHTVDGKAFAAEIHFVHFNQKYGDFETAVDKENGLAVLGIFAKVGKEHEELAKLTEVLEKIPFKDDEFPLESIRPESLLPKNRSYWTYPGSLTTPPLYESVTWIVFKQPIEISRLQLKMMRSLRIGDER